MQLYDYCFQVTFVGEEGIDTGGLSREFWRLLMEGFKQTYFVGCEGKLTLARNIPALEVPNTQTEHVFLVSNHFRQVILELLEPTLQQTLHRKGVVFQFYIQPYFSICVLGNALICRLKMKIFLTQMFNVF